MEKKLAFINQLITNNKLSAIQKERIWQLSLTELGKMGNWGKNMLKRIESQLGVRVTIISSDMPNTIDWLDPAHIVPIDFTALKEKKPAESNPKASRMDASNSPEGTPEYLNPSELYKFLLAFNQDPVLKYICHDIDSQDVVEDIAIRCQTEQYCFEKHHVLILEHYQNLLKKFKISKNVLGLINAYLNGIKGDASKGWSEDNILINWSTPELVEWSKKNPGLVPNPGRNLMNELKYKGFTFKAFKTKLTGKKISNMSGLGIHFKHLFHLRADHYLNMLIERTNEKDGWGAKMDFTFENFWENIELFTDVGKVMQAYKAILKMILECSPNVKPQVTLSFYVEDKDVFFLVHHRNSTYRKTLADTLERVGESQTNLIKNQINGLCDLFIQADFGNGEYAEVNLWSPAETKATIVPKMSGVQYKLKFKK